jgi:hypothetical protein
LREIELDNLDRARLLDIVLWSGDTTSALRRKIGSTASKIRTEGGSSELLGAALQNGRVIKPSLYGVESARELQAVAVIDTARVTKC